MAVLGEDAARAVMHRSDTHFVKEQPLNGEYTHLLKDREAFIRDGLVESMPRLMTENSVKNFRRTLHSATLVFTHAILDAAVYDCTRICAACAPERWAPLVGDRKVTLTDVAGASYQELLKNAITNGLERLECESLLAKVDRTFKICRPTKTEYLTNGFRFDRDRLARLDALRHNVVHAPSGTWLFDSIYEDIQFMQSSGVHIFVMVAETFNLCFSGREAMELLASRANESNDKPES